MEADIEIDAATLEARLADPKPPVLVDVRERWEYDVCHLPGSILLAEADFPAVLKALQGEPDVVVICHHGMRSYSAALFLREKGVASARSLAGGLDHWARTVDTAMARY